MPDTQIDPIIQYIIVRKSLGMSAGKIAAQVGHGVQNFIIHYSASQVLKVKMHDAEQFPQQECDLIKITSTWISAGSRKIVKEASEEEWNEVKSECGKNCIIIKDNGLTQVAPGSETVLVMYPKLKSQASQIIKKIPLLK